MGVGHRANAALALTSIFVVSSVACDDEGSQAAPDAGATVAGGAGGADAGGASTGGTGEGGAASFVGEPGFAATGSTSDGESFTVTGDGFGNKRQAAPIFFDTVDDTWINGLRSDSYDGLPNASDVPTTSEDPWFTSNVGPVILRNDVGLYGNRSKTYFTEFLEDGHIDGWLGSPSGFPDPVLGEVTQVYVRWYVNPSFDPHQSDGSHKFIRLWDTPSGAEVGIRISWTQMHMTYDQDQSGSTPSWADWGGTPGTWNRMELYVDTETGVIKAWTNGTLIHDVSDFAPGMNNTTDPGVYQGLHPRLWGLDGSGDPVPDWLGQTMGMTDYWADSTLQRFEIADGSDLFASATREPQPAEAWADGAVMLRLNYGALGSLSGKYLFHVDESNVPTRIGRFE